MEDEVTIVPEGKEERRRRERTILAVPSRAAHGFLDFIRERGVMGLAIGFVLGSAVQKLVTAFVTDIVTPFVSLLLGRADGIRGFAIGRFMIGDFIAVSIDFLILALVVFFIFKGLGLEKLDKPKT